MELEMKNPTFRLLPVRKVTVGRRLKVWISNCYTPSLFGIRGNYETSYKTGQYIETGTPGTGFFVRTTSSKAYKHFCTDQRAKLNVTYWDMLRGKDFNFAKEIARAQEALNDCKDKNRFMLLESYLNVLPYAQEAEYCERIVNGIKKASHRQHKMTSHQRHALAAVKSRISQLGHDVRDIQLNQTKLCTEEEYNRFANVVKTFTEVVASHRIWHSQSASTSNLGGNFVQVYFDLGIFDFVQTPLMTPLMRDSEGKTYYFFPKFLVVAKDAVDFETYDLKSLNFLYRMVPYDNISTQILDSYSSVDEDSKSDFHHRNYDEYGDGLLVTQDTVSLNEEEKSEHIHERVVGKLNIPELKLRFYVRDARALKHFAKALEEYIYG